MLRWRLGPVQTVPGQAVHPTQRGDPDEGTCAPKQARCRRTRVRDDGPGRSVTIDRPAPGPRAHREVRPHTGAPGTLGAASGLPTGTPAIGFCAPPHPPASLACICRGARPLSQFPQPTLWAPSHVPVAAVPFPQLTLSSRSAGPFRTQDRGNRANAIDSYGWCVPASYAHATAPLGRTARHE
jgi:hypothetical protein